MPGWDLGELARAAEAQIDGRGLPVTVEAVGTDTRSLPPACLFVALRGERFDGHAFVGRAVDAGALAVLVDGRAAADLPNIPVPRLVVDDTLTALGNIAAYARRKHHKPIVGITGSNGKTTTKELCAAALSCRGPVHKTAGNFNNLIGLPLTLLEWPDSANIGVIEMGMNVPGEIARLTQITQPTVGLITNVAGVHLEGLGSVDAVGRAKGELYDNLESDAVGVVNGDDPTVHAVAVPLLGERKRLVFGTSPKSDVHIKNIEVIAEGLRVTLHMQRRDHTFALPLHGPHNAHNAAAAAAAALAVGVDADAIVAGLPQVAIPGGRMRVVRDLGGPDSAAISVNVIDDTYNANPQSMAAAFVALAGLAGTSRRVAVLGDMFELGTEAAHFHADVGADAGRSGVARVLCLGEHGEHTAAGAQRVGADATAYDDIESLLAALDAYLRDGDWIVVKGSRGMRMERVVEHLQSTRTTGTD